MQHFLFKKRIISQFHLKPRCFDCVLFDVTWNSNALIGCCLTPYSSISMFFTYKYVSYYPMEMHRTILSNIYKCLQKGWREFRGKWKVEQKSKNSYGQVCQTTVTKIWPKTFTTVSRGFWEEVCKEQKKRLYWFSDGNLKEIEWHLSKM